MANHQDIGPVANEHELAIEQSQRHGLRRQSGSGDGAFARTETYVDSTAFRPDESGVALRFPPQSMTACRTRTLLHIRSQPGQCQNDLL